MALSPSIVEAYQRDGVVVLRGLVTSATIADLARGVEANLAAPGPWANEYTPQGTTGRFFDDYVNWQRIEDFAHHATTGPVPAAARELMGCTTARLFHEHVLVKEAETREVTPWHHDDPVSLVGLDDRGRQCHGRHATGGAQRDRGKRKDRRRVPAVVSTSGVGGEARRPRLTIEMTASFSGIIPRMIAPLAQ
ncbi:MAG: phytanoyl-CoA dioxygenase family protein [Actinomycetota bacterium]